MRGSCWKNGHFQAFIYILADAPSAFHILADKMSALQLFGVVSYEVVIRITFGNHCGRCAAFFKIVETLEVLEILMVAVNDGFVFVGIVIVFPCFVRVGDGGVGEGKERVLLQLRVGGSGGGFEVSVTNKNGQDLRTFFESPSVSSRP